MNRTLQSGSRSKNTTKIKKRNRILSTQPIHIKNNYEKKFFAVNYNGHNGHSTLQPISQDLYLDCELWRQAETDFPLISP